MNVAFFLLPKAEVTYLSYKSTMRQAIEKMECHHYTAIPLVDEHGKYKGTLTEGDLLWKMKNTPSLTFNNTNNIKIVEIPLHHNNQAISINVELETIINQAIIQNFVPVVDDNDIFIGIITRSEIIKYLSNFIQK